MTKGGPKGKASSEGSNLFTAHLRGKSSSLRAIRKVHNAGNSVMGKAEGVIPKKTRIKYGTNNWQIGHLQGDDGERAMVRTRGGCEGGVG